MRAILAFPHRTIPQPANAAAAESSSSKPVCSGCKRDAGSVSSRGWTGQGSDSAAKWMGRFFGSTTIGGEGRRTTVPPENIVLSSAGYCGYIFIPVGERRQIGLAMGKYWAKRILRLWPAVRLRQHGALSAERACKGLQGASN